MSETKATYILKDETGKIVKTTNSFLLAKKGGYEQTETTQDIVRYNGALYLESDCPEPDPATKAEKIRIQRNALLAQSDWTQLSDAPLSTVQKTAWAVYRQALRNIPEQSDFPNNVSFPESPNQE